MTGCGSPAQTNPSRQQGPSVPETMSMMQHFDLQVIMLAWSFTNAALDRAAG